MIKPLPLKLPLTLALAGSLLVACERGNDPFAERPVELSVGICPMTPSGDSLVLACATTSISPFTAIDYDYVLSTVIDVPNLRVIRRFSGVVTAADTAFIATIAGVGVLKRDTLEFGATTGVLRYTVEASGEGVITTTEIIERPVADAGPPTIASAAFVDTTSLEPGDTLRVSLGLADDARLGAVTVTLDYPVDVVVTVPLTRAIVDTVVEVPIPLANWTIDSVTVIVSVADHAGATTTQGIGRVGIRDRVAPTITALFAEGESGSYGKTDLIGVNVAAGDRFGVRWIGWRVGEPVVDADSVAVSGSATNRLLEVAASRLGIGMRTLRFFARDSTGNLTQAVRPLSGGQFTYPLDVLDAVRLAGTVIDGYAGTRDVQLDTARGTLFRRGIYTMLLDVHGWPGLSLAERLFLPGSSGSQPGRMQRSADGDSLFVLLDPELRAVGVLDLDAAVRVLQPRALPPSALPEYAYAMAVTADGRAFIATARPSTLTNRLLEFDLATGVETERNDVTVQGLSDLVATPDGQRIVATMMGGPGAWYGQVYSLANDSWSAPQALGAQDFDPRSPRISTDGSVVLIGTAVFDGAMQRTRTLLPITAQIRDAALSPDGSTAYISVDVVGNAIHTIARVFRTADGLALGSIVLPRATSYLEVLSDGRTLYAAGAVTSIVLQLP